MYRKEGQTKRQSEKQRIFWLFCVSLKERKQKNNSRLK